MHVRVVEVGPRDGLQAEQTVIPTDVKLRLVEALAGAGLEEIEATSFVSPKHVPQLADATQLWPLLPTGPRYSALVPNLRGLENALSVGVKRIALFTAASDAFTLKNIGVSIADSLAIFTDVVAQFRSQVPDGWVRGYISTAFECPYVGPVSPDKVVSVASALISLGLDEICLGDTIGVAGPTETRHLVKVCADVVPIDMLAMHFHDTRGTALANVYAALESGVRIFDSSAGGLGGCPYAPGAGGNLATEDLVYLLKREGVGLKIDLERLSRATLEVLGLIGRAPGSKVQQAILSRANADSCAN